MSSRTLADRIGGVNAVSMPGWLLTLPGVLIVVPWIIPGAVGSAMVPWIALSFAAQLVAGLVLWLAWLSVLPSSPRPSRMWVALTVFAVAGLARGAVLSLVSWTVGIADAEHALARLVTPVPVMVLVLSVAAVLVDTTRRHRKVSSDLNREIQRERYLAVESADIVRAYRRDLVAQTRDVVIEQLDKAAHFSPDPAATATRVQQVCDDVVRPLSHELQQRSVSDERLIADLPDASVKTPIPVGAYLLGAFTRWPFTPALTTLAMMAVVFSELLHYVGLRHGVVVLAVTGLAMFVLLWLAQRLVGSRVRSMPAPGAVIVVGVIWIAIAGITAEVMHRVAAGNQVNEQTAMASELASPFLHAAVLASCLVAMAGFALARSILEQLDEEEARLAVAADEVAWAAAKLRQQTWSEQRNLGRLIHRDLQARLVSLALQIQMDDGNGVASAVRRAEREIDDLLDRAGGPATWRQSVDEMRAVWSYSLAFDLGFPADVESALDQDPVAGQAVAEVAREATTNAVRHGEASAVTVRARLIDSVVELVVTDDGAHDDQAPSPGIGSRVMDEVCLTRHLERLAKGHRLTAMIPCQADHELV